ncbi:class I SAM-dependent methyltransferase [Planobispora takensis]|uniref:Methyltransferase type 11 domain-containing protein n=1 Tax=Planobispora takensis TaxID=1367882 RepID=A0A8J3T4E2_9ACTN|nr:class I SAM-dependent methyltransferase [Planobispora takensis]GII03840.1 hypothetical protein Pta02_58480 [Planobispora takensis]
MAVSEKHDRFRDGADDPARAARRMWALGDYTPIAGLIAGLGRELVEACGAGAGHRVLDVGAGTGNAALAAAERGAAVTAADLTPELLETGRRRAEERGLTLRWVEADAQSLPFGDGEFDVVLSAVGAIFAPDHTAAAGELVRVCRSGGTVAMANWTPGGAAGEFLRILGRYAPPPPPGSLSPLMWGEPEHVTALFAGYGMRPETEARSLRVEFDGPPERLIEIYRANFAPVLATYAGLAGDPGRAAALDRDLLDLAVRENRAAPGEPGHYEYEYLLVVAGKAGGQG